MEKRGFLRVLNDNTEFERLKQSFEGSQRSGSFPIERPDDACAPHTATPPPDEPEIHIDGEAWAERGHSLERGIELAVKHRILPAMPTEEDVARVLQDGGPDVGPFRHWFELIRLGGRAMLFDTETSTFPNRHD